MNKEITEGNTTPYVMMSMSWDTYLTLGKYFQELKGKFKEYNALLCFYRQSLEESICETK